MGKRPKGGLRSVFLLLLILAASVAVGVAHYVLRTGRAPEVPRAASQALHQAKESLGETLDKAKQAAPDLPTVRPWPAAGDIRVYFAPSQPLNPFGIDHAFLRLLERAEHAICAAFYELQFERAAEVLIAKHEAGVRVAIVSDSDYRDRDAVQACIRAGIRVVFDERSAYMHNKFCVVDDAHVWTGSTNVSQNGLFKNNNNAVLIASEQLAADYTTEFDEMFQRGRFGKGGPDETPFPRLVVDETNVECYFAPEDHVRREIIDEIEAAEATIDFMAFSFTSSEIAKAMADRIQDGVVVRGLFEKSQAGSKHSQDEWLAQRGARVGLDTNPHTMHHKVIIIDTETVITGSYNFSQAAETRNDENVLIIHAPDVAQKYRDEFESLLP